MPDCWYGWCMTCHVFYWKETFTLIWCNPVLHLFPAHERGGSREGRAYAAQVFSGCTWHNSKQSPWTWVVPAHTERTDQEAMQESGPGLARRDCCHGRTGSHGRQDSSHRRAVSCGRWGGGTHGPKGSHGRWDWSRDEREGSHGRQDGDQEQEGDQPNIQAPAPLPVPGGLMPPTWFRCVWAKHLTWLRGAGSGGFWEVFGLSRCFGGV